MDVVEKYWEQEITFTQVIS